MSKEWKERPSSLLGLTDDSYMAYCMDEAVYMFGRYVEGEMQAAEEATTNAKSKGVARQRALTTILTGTSEVEKSAGVQPVAPKQQFRDPAAMFKK